MTRPEVRAYRSLSSNPYLNLAIEEWLFRSTPPSSHILLLWRNSPCVVIGRNQNPWKECNVHRLSQDAIPWLRRKSGGGTVFHDLGNSIYSIIEPRASFTRRKNAELVASALRHLDVPAEVNARHDLVVEGKKVSGSAFKLTNARAYHHGTMLIDADLARLRRYLKVDRPTLVTKGVPSVPSPVTNVREYSYTVDHLSFCEAVVDQFRKTHDLGYLKVETVDEGVLHREAKVREVMDELMSDEWKLGQTPEFVHDIALVDAGLTCHVASRHGRITAVDFVPDPTSPINPEFAHDELFAAGIEDLKMCLQGKWYHPTAVHQAWRDLVDLQRGAISESHSAMVKVRRVVDQLATLL